MIELRFVRLPHAADLPPPSRATASSAGWDVCAAVDQEVELAPGERQLVPTGLRVAVPQGYELQVRPRSGRALREGLALVNAPGTIDSDYRGEVGVVLINLGSQPLRIVRGDRIAQLVVAAVPEVRWVEGDDLPETGRDGGGFGSTGR
ncbi:MAG: dUTP diphosphatase [Acidobacteria bacterium]|nr:MAG: dUTP diphosphatase [Acidobacteriota bacterium]REK10179.1 MAG: dUTP diphosphatase [Acidobacteriota bacterium]